jgi:hypothetical protein
VFGPPRPPATREDEDRVGPPRPETGLDDEVVVGPPRPQAVGDDEDMVGPPRPPATVHDEDMVGPPRPPATVHDEDMVGPPRPGTSSTEDDDDDEDAEDEDDEDEFRVPLSNEIVLKGHTKACHSCLLDFRGWSYNGMHDISWVSSCRLDWFTLVFFMFGGFKELMCLS